VKFAGLPGWLLSAGIAASTTVTVGYAAMIWFEHGQKPSRATLQKVMRDVTLYLKDKLATLAPGRRDRAELSERVQSALNDLPSQLRLPARQVPAAEQPAVEGPARAGATPLDGMQTTSSL